MEAFDELFSKEEPPDSNRHTFIVRIWSEMTEKGGEAQSWRGSIENVVSKRRLYFHDFNTIRRFIEESLPPGQARPRSWWQYLLHKLHLDD